MPQFMVMILENEAEERRLTPSDTKALVEGHTRYERTLRRASAYVDGERLRPVAEAMRVCVRDGKTRVEAGPFPEAPLSGYYVVKAENLDAAVKLTENCPMAPGASLEVRPLMKGSLNPEKASQKGRVFAFAVLGNAPNEQGWIEVMDRIDASSRDNFPTDGVLGGVRLHAPGAGRRVVSTGGRRAVLDGPFLESKEVIGGLLFIRMAGVNDAVHWASETEFVKLGSVEIRELWRS